MIERLKKNELTILFLLSTALIISQVGQASALTVVATAFFFVLMRLKFKVPERGVYYEN
ncbi:MAG: hypothetical protein ABF633_20615 [Clostridium sp.]